RRYQSSDISQNSDKNSWAVGFTDGCWNWEKGFCDRYDKRIQRRSFCVFRRSFRRVKEAEVCSSVSFAENRQASQFDILCLDVNCIQMECQRIQEYIDSVRFSGINSDRIG